MGLVGHMGPIDGPGRRTQHGRERGRLAKRLEAASTLPEDERLAKRLEAAFASWTAQELLNRQTATLKKSALICDICG